MEKLLSLSEFYKLMQDHYFPFDITLNEIVEWYSNGYFSSSFVDKVCSRDSYYAYLYSLEYKIFNSEILSY